MKLRERIKIMTAFELYLLFILLPNIGSACLGLSLIGAFVIFIWAMAHYVTRDINKPPKKRLLITSVILFLISTSMPSSKEMAFILAGSYASDIEGIEELPENTIKALNKYLEEAVKD